MSLTRRGFLKFSAIAMSNLYLPIITRPLMSPELGAQIEGEVSAVAQWIVPGRAYQIPISWRDFASKLDFYDANVRALAGCVLCLGVKHTPPQYRLWPEWTSSPPSPAGYTALAEFIKLLIHRYAPARVELYNEPNVGRQECKSFQEFFGAWIDDTSYKPTAAQHAGEMYGAMLRAVYPAVKVYYPTVQIYAGALMRNQFMLDFLDGMAGAPADALSYHHYLSMGAPFAGLDQMAADLQAHTALPIAISETSVLTYATGQEHEQAKANWLRYLIDNRERLSIRSVMFYTLAGNSWMNSDLAPGPAWDVFRSY